MRRFQQQLRRRKTRDGRRGRQWDWVGPEDRRGQDKELQKLVMLMNVFDESFAIEGVRIWVCRELILLLTEEGDAMELSQKQRMLEVVRYLRQGVF